MKHRKYAKWIVLSLYGELEDEEKQHLEGHLLSCPACSYFKEELSGMFREGNWNRESTGEQGLLEARRESHPALVREMRHAAGQDIKKTGPAAWKGRIPAIPVYAAGGMAVLALATGLLAGFVIFGGNSGEVSNTHAVLSQISAANSSDVAISDVRFLAGTKQGDLRFSFNLSRRYVLDGSLDEKDVQKVLAFALVNSDNPGVRLRTIGMLDASEKADPEIVAAMVKAVETDANTGVRREALLSLEKFPFSKIIKDALLFVLQNDRNPGMRVAAINFLAGKVLGATSGTAVERRVDPRVLEVLKEKSVSDQNRYVRLKAADLLKEFKEL